MKEILGGLLTIIVAVVASVGVVAVVENNNNSVVTEALDQAQKDYAKALEDNMILSQRVILLRDSVDELQQKLSAAESHIELLFLRTDPEPEIEVEPEPEKPKMEEQKSNPIFDFLEGKDE